MSEWDTAWHELMGEEDRRGVLFTVEGHMSDMFVGPCAEVGRTLEAEGLVRWQPVGYNNTALPFDNESGVRELDRLFSDATAFPPGTRWGAACFSQGGIVWCIFWLHHILPVNGKHHDRLKDWVGTLAYGNPYRERDVIAPWITDPPRKGTQGISDVRMTGGDYGGKHMEVARHADIYAENTVDDAGEDKTAVYKMVQNEWTGGRDSILMQLLEVIQRPLPEVIAIFLAITSGVLFLANMTPHGGYDLGPCTDFMRRQLTA